PDGIYYTAATDTGTATVRATAGGLSGTTAVTVSAPGYPAYPYGFTDTSGLTVARGEGPYTPAIFNGGLRLTDGHAFEATGAYYATTPRVDAFPADFSYQPPANADGFTFLLQDQGPGAVGQGGGNLGYVGLRNSVAVVFQSSGNRTGLWAGGTAGGLNPIG